MPGVRTGPRELFSNGVVGDAVSPVQTAAAAITTTASQWFAWEIRISESEFLP